MSRFISEQLRQTVRLRANQRCEYCQYPELLALFRFEMEHIIAEKHGGMSTSDNLALACPPCNRHKGSDLGSFDPLDRQFAFLYHPRDQAWNDHFQLLSDGRIEGLTPTGRVTVQLLQINHSDRVAERLALLATGLWE